MGIIPPAVDVANNSSALYNSSAEIDFLVIGKCNSFAKSKIGGHVIPAMISKFIEAKLQNSKTVKLLGTGKPIREFIHSNDLAEAILVCLKLSKSRSKKLFNLKLPIINIGTGENISISKLAKIISKYVTYKGQIIFDKKSPDGTYRKDLNSRIIRSLGWHPKIKLKDGLKKVILQRM